MNRPTLILALLLALLLGASLCAGAAPIGLSALFSEESETSALARAIILDIRLPRTLLAALVGAALGMTGAALQGWLRNPLADPGLFGASGCAGLGAVLVIYSGLYAGAPLLLPIGGILGAAVGLSLILLLVRAQASTLGMILGGIAIGSLASALTALALNLSPDPYAALEIAFWLLGSVTDRGMEHVAVAAPLIFVGMALLLTARRGLDALSLGEATAASSGIKLSALRSRLLIGTALATGAASAVSGGVSFVGLVVPHLLRPFLGHRPGALLLPSALAGAALVTAADVGVRIFSAQAELKLGVVTSLIGAPFFLALLIRNRGWAR